MIMLLDDTYQMLTMVPTEEDLFGYLRKDWKTLEEPEKEDWQFVRYSHKLLAKFLEEMEEDPSLSTAWQACEQEQDMLFICTGDADNPSLRLVTPDLDIPALRQEWSRAYCKAHNMHIVTD